MSANRFDPAHVPRVVVAVEVPTALRDEMRRWADHHGQTLERWCLAALQETVEAERDIHADQQRAKPRRK